MLSWIRHQSSSIRPPPPPPPRGSPTFLNYPWTSVVMLHWFSPSQEQQKILKNKFQKGIYCRSILWLLDLITISMPGDKSHSYMNLFWFPCSHHSKNILHIHLAKHFYNLVLYSGPVPKLHWRKSKLWSPKANNFLIQIFWYPTIFLEI